VPAVLVGSLLSSRAPDKYIRPAITFVIFASGLKYVGVPTYPLGFVMGGILVAGLAYWLAVRRPWQHSQAGHSQAGHSQAGHSQAGRGEPAPALANGVDGVPERADGGPERAETPLDDVPVR